MNGSFLPDQQAAGDNGNVYLHPAWNLAAIFNYDQYASDVIFQNVDKFALQPINAISNATGAYPASDVNTYTYSPNHVFYTQMAGQAGWPFGAFGYVNGCWYNTPQGAHAANQFELPYMMTGDWYILSHHLNYVFGIAGTYASTNTNGIGNHWVGAASSAITERDQAWSFMLQAEAVLLLPDNDSSKSTDAFKILGGLTKPDAQTWLENQWVYLGDKNYRCGPNSPFGVCPGTLISPGVGTSCPVGATCGNFTNFNSPDIRWLSDTSFNFGFETGYFYNSFGHAYEIGMCSANCQQTYHWYMQGQATYLTDPNVGSSVVAATIEHLNASNAPGSPCQALDTAPGTTPSWACAWRGTFVTGYLCGTHQCEIGSLQRYPSGTVNLGAGFGTPGNTITVTLPANNLISNGGTAYYASGNFIASNSGPASGFCVIVAVTSANTFTCTVTLGFAASSYTNTSVPAGGIIDGSTLQWEMPQPTLGDATGMEVAYLVANGVPGAGGFRYANIQQSGCAMANYNIGYPDSSTCNTINGYSTASGGFPGQSGIPFNIVHR
jgi:hypothetical protein